MNNHQICGYDLVFLTERLRALCFIENGLFFIKVPLELDGCPKFSIKLNYKAKVILSYPCFEINKNRNNIEITSSIKESSSYLTPISGENLIGSKLIGSTLTL